MRATARVSARTPPPLGIRRESTQYAYSASSLHNLLHLRFANSRSSVGVFFVFLIKPSARSASSGGNTESSELPFGLAEANVPPYFRLRTSGMPIGQPNCTRIQSRPIVRLSPLSTSCLGLVPRLRRSDHLRNDTQPLRAGLTFGGRPSGPRIHGDFAVSLLSQLGIGRLVACRMAKYHPALTGWAHVWRSALRASHPCRFCGVLSLSTATGKLAAPTAGRGRLSAPNLKGEGSAHLSSRYRGWREWHAVV